MLDSRGLVYDKLGENLPMKNVLKLVAGLVVMGLLTYASAGAQDASPLTNGKTFHAFPTVQEHMNAAPPPPQPLLYHTGGPVMQTGVQLFSIFWVPPKLQNGNPTSLTAHYESIQNRMLADYPAHGLDNNNTQYYQIIAGVTKYIQNKGSGTTSFVDTNPYPASGCSDAVTPGNCITDAQLAAEVARVMTLKGWTGGLNKMYFVYTSTGEGSCFDSSSSECAYTAYCAYHSYFVSGTTPVVYANMPYADPTYCYSPGTGQTSPNGDIPADAAANVSSHELTEAITDPELNAWFDSTGAEIGDICAWSFGKLTWDANKANEMWNGHFYTLQTEYDNHSASCVQVGP
jgi:hypothetical protein